jgi:hypothetical protein
MLNSDLFLWLCHCYVFCCCLYVLLDVILLCILCGRSRGVGALYSQTRGLGILSRWLVLGVVDWGSGCVDCIFKSILMYVGQSITILKGIAPCIPTYRLLPRSLVLVVLIPQLHGIAHIGHTYAKRRCLAFPHFLSSVTALGTTAGPDTLPAIGDSRCLVALLDSRVR